MEFAGAHIGISSGKKLTEDCGLLTVADLIGSRITDPRAVCLAVCYAGAISTIKAFDFEVDVINQLYDLYERRKIEYLAVKDWLLINRNPTVSRLVHLNKKILEYKTKQDVNASKVKNLNNCVQLAVGLSSWVEGQISVQEQSDLARDILELPQNCPVPSLVEVVGMELDRHYADPINRTKIVEFARIVDAA